MMQQCAIAAGCRLSHIPVSNQPPERWGLRLFVATLSEVHRCPSIAIVTRAKEKLFPARLCCPSADDFDACLTLVGSTLVRTIGFRYLPQTRFLRTDFAALSARTVPF
jgi:hypothetical protein